MTASLYESTGLLGESTIRKIDFESGEMLKKVALKPDEFGEGLTKIGDRLYQLTWQNNIGYVYDLELNQVGSWEYDYEGWGLATDGTHLIVSDGTAVVRFLDPETFEEVRAIFVRRVDRGMIGQLNELEFYGSKIYANVYNTDRIYRIHSETGEVEAIIDLAGLWPVKDRPDRRSVLNGIAINPDTKKMVVTGKLCPNLYEIEIAD